MVVIKTKKNTSNGINKPYLFLATGGIFVDDVLSSERLIDILECDKNKLKKYIKIKRIHMKWILFCVKNTSEK